MAKAQCPECGDSVIEYDTAAGNGFCINCGTVVEENTIVAEVGFSETASGAAMVQGSYVGQGATRARMSGPLGNRGSMESREQTLANASRRIHEHASAMRLSERIASSANRLFTLALSSGFVKGRKGEYVVAVCLYVACRKEKTSHMLIDFSDFLRINVFTLGGTYLKFVKDCHQKLPLIEPSIYIARFAALLEFGNETGKVATDAIRLVQRFDRDWMQTGRRPSGMCGAALLLAARMNNFRRSLQEIVQVVKIADVTLKKRLEEFKRTPSSQLTLQDFRTVWIEDAVDPPAFTQARKKEQQDEEREEGRLKKGKRGKKRTGKRKREEEQEDVEAEGSEKDGEGSPAPSPVIHPFDAAELSQGIFAGVIDPALLEGGSTAHPSSPHSDVDPLFLPAEDDPLNVAVDSVVEAEVSEALRSCKAQTIAEALDNAEERRLAGIEPVDELQGLDEAELDRMICSEAEVRIKEKLWVEFNRDYLEALAAKGQRLQNGDKEPRKRKKHKPRDTSTPGGATAAEATKNMMVSKKKFSKKINYAAVDALFIPRNRAASEDKDDKDDEIETIGLFTIDEDNMEVVEESGQPTRGHIDTGLDDGDDDEPVLQDEGYQQEV